MRRDAAEALAPLVSSLGGLHLVLQSALADGVAFDPSLQQDGLTTAEGSLVVAAMIVVLDEASDVSFEISGQVVVFEQDAVLQV